MSAPPYSIARALDHSVAAPLLDQLALRQRLRTGLVQAMQELAPWFACPSVGFFDLRETTLMLTVASAAQSAKLRQVLPALENRLQQQGFRVYEIRLRTEPGETTYPVPVGQETAAAKAAEAAEAAGEKTKRDGQRAAAEAFAAKLALTLPDSPLQRAAAQLQARLRRPPDRA